MNKGKVVTKGSTIGVIAPSSPTSAENVEEAKRQIESLGFHVHLGESCFARYGGYLAGSPSKRADEINEMFERDEIDAIICLRGGYGTPQLLERIDYSMIEQHPKLFVGFSDITALHLAFSERANLATIHGPMATSAIATSETIDKDSLMHVLTKKEPLGEIKNPETEQIECLVEGVTSGKIIGGNLSLLSATMGTPFEVNTKDKLLFIEEINEEPYQIDRMITQLALGGKFSDAKGIILGSFTGCLPKKYEDSFHVNHVLEEIISPYNKPTILNVQAGHDPWNITIPFGVEAELDATNKKLVIKESVGI